MLGEQDPFLVARASSRCTGIPAETLVAVTEGGAASASGTINYYDLVGLSDTAVAANIMSTAAASTLGSRIAAVSGTSITSVTSSSIATEPTVLSTGEGTDLQFMSFSGDRLLSIYSTNEAAIRAGVVCATLSGTTYAPGTTVYPYTSSGASGLTFRLIKLSENTALCLIYDASASATTSSKAFVVTLSGTAVSFGSVYTLTATTSLHSDLGLVSATEVLWVRSDGSLGMSSKLLTVSGTVVSESANHQILDFDDTPATRTMINVAMETAASGFIVYGATSTSALLRTRRFTLSGHEVTVSPISQLSVKTLRTLGREDLSVVYLPDKDLLFTLFVEHTTNEVFLNISRAVAGGGGTQEPLFEQRVGVNTAGAYGGSAKLAAFGSDKYVAAYRDSGTTLRFHIYRVTTNV